MKDELRTYAKCCETEKTSFKGKEVVQFQKCTFSPSYIAYDPDYGVFGFKYAFLRYYQFAIAIEIFQYMHSFDVSSIGLVDLPSSVEERIRYLLRKDWVDDIDAAILAGRYYVRLCELQIILKFNYYSKTPDRRETEFREMKGASIDRAQQAIKAFSKVRMLKRHSAQK